jgi:quercetin dioxygenase-like cupin family protein
MQQMFNIQEKLKDIKEPWKPLELGRFNGQIVRLIMTQGEFKIHDHPFDECIFVYKGDLHLWTDKGDIDLKEGEGVVMQKGTKHNPSTKGIGYILSIIPE